MSSATYDRLRRALNILLTLGRARQVFMARAARCIANQFAANETFNPRLFALLNYDALDLSGAATAGVNAVAWRPISDVAGFNPANVINQWRAMPTKPPFADFVEAVRSTLLSPDFAPSWQDVTDLWFPPFEFVQLPDVDEPVPVRITPDNIIAMAPTGDVVIAQRDVNAENRLAELGQRIAQSTTQLCVCCDMETNQTLTYAVDMHISNCAFLHEIHERVKTYRDARVYQATQRFEIPRDDVTVESGEYILMRAGMYAVVKAIPTDTEVQDALAKCGAATCQYYCVAAGAKMGPCQ